MDGIHHILSLIGNSWLIVGIVGSLVLLVSLSAFFPSMDPQEPPSIRPRIPFVGHIVGLFRNQVHYFETLNAKYGLPIYTLPMLTGKTYVVTSPDLVQSVLRIKNDGLSVESFMVNVVAKNLDDQSPEAMKVWSHVPKDKKEPYMLQDVTRTFAKQMNLGPQVHSLNLTALKTFSSLVDDIRVPREENLYLFLRNTFSIAATTGLFGPHNPMFTDTRLSDSQWDMEAKSLWVFIGLFPKFLFPKAFAGRVAIQSAYTKYHAAGHDSGPGVSAAMRIHSETMRGYGITSEDIGKADVGILHGATSNAALIFYWFVVRVFSDPGLLADLQAELQTVTAERQGDEKAALGLGRRAMTIDISRVVSTCPLLCAVHQEVLRLQTFSLVTRVVTTDTLISDSQGTQYLLKSGAMLQIPTAVPQTSTEVWGPDARGFNARRFLKSAGERESLSEKTRKRAFFPFSGGTHKCPGRHFATAEHLGMVAMLILGFEITTVDGSAIIIPQNPEAQRGISSGVGKPNDEFMKLQVRVGRRKGWEDVLWRFKVAEEKE